MNQKMDQAPMPHTTKVKVAVIGGGAAGLMTCETLCEHGISVHLYDSMPSMGRKFLMAGKSGLNLTHAEPFDGFMKKFGSARSHLEPIIQAFTPSNIQDWAKDLGIETFVGSSQRVFPKDFKAAPLLRAWLRRLRQKGTITQPRHKWTGWTQDGGLTFDTPKGQHIVFADKTILALGGASWPTLGSDAHWVKMMRSCGVNITPFKPTNCGFDVDWSPHFQDRFEGQPLKNIRLTFQNKSAMGDIIITKTGIEGGPVYTLSSPLRDAIDEHGTALLTIDLMPDRTGADIQKRLNRPQGKKSMSTHLKRTLNLTGSKAGLLRECSDKVAFTDPIHLTSCIKSLPVELTKTRPIDEAISSAGGIAWHSLDENLQLTALPGVFVAGEMIDWEAPTGGYLLSACMAQGRWAGQAVARS